MKPILHVCITCRAGGPASDQPPGARLLATITSLGSDAVELREVTCLASCDHGCAAALSMPGRWTYLLGRLNEGHAADLLAYAAIYAAHPTGAVLPSKRPDSLKSVVLARVPDLGVPGEGIAA